jgi:dolichyl-phosphate-mannose-protein mannosyltransferase
MDTKSTMASTLLLILILFLALGSRLYRLGEPNKYYFDEVYHAVTAKAYARNDPAGYEWWHSAPEPDTAYEWLHPPLGKVFMAIGWALAGQNAFAWRLPGAFFGVGVIALTYFLSLSLFKSQTTALLAAFVATCDGLLLAQSRIGMNDIYVTVFILLSLWCYWQFVLYSQKALTLRSRWWLLLAALATGLSVATKWSGVFLLGIFGLFELIRAFSDFWAFLRRLPFLFLAFLVIPAGVYVLSYGQFWLQGHTIAQFIELHNQIWYYQTHLDATHPFQSQAWQWPLALRPVWYFVEYRGSMVSTIYNSVNPFVAWFGILAVFFVGLEAVFAKKIKQLPLLYLFIAYFLVWAPWLLSPRIMFSYHYTPAIPLLSIMVGYLLHTMWRAGWLGRMVALGVVALIWLGFVFFVPIWTGLPLQVRILDRFFWLASWR